MLGSVTLNHSAPQSLNTALERPSSSEHSAAVPVKDTAPNAEPSPQRGSVSRAAATYNANGRIEGVENPYASTILSAISARLMTDAAQGAEPAELQSRLEAGLQGFSEGFRQAYEQLSASGLLTDEVDEAIAGTYRDVMAGIQQVASKLGLEVPPDAGLDLDELGQARATAPLHTPAEQRHRALSSVTSPTSEWAQGGMSALQSLLESQMEVLERMAHTRSSASSEASYSVANGRRNSFEFQLITADGDKVRLSAQASWVGVSHAHGVALDFNGQGHQSLQFEVQGDLDAEELGAISDLLSQVEKLSQSFFNGDLDRAFTMAQNLGFDTDEIAGFALDLNRVQVDKVNAAYGKETTEFANSNPKSLFDVIDRIADAAQKTQNLGQSQQWLIELLHQTAEVGGYREAGQTLAPNLQAMVEKFF